MTKFYGNEYEPKGHGSIQIFRCQNRITEIQYVRKVAVHLQKVLEVMSTSLYTGLNHFNFIRKHFLQITYKRYWCALIKRIGSEVHERLIQA
jgi:hypothetical protein